MVKIQKRNYAYAYVPFVKASATVIPAGSFVKLASGLVVPNADTGTKIGYCEAGAIAGETEVLISPRDCMFKLDATTNFAAIQRWVSYNILTTAGVEELNQALVTVPVLTVSPIQDGGVVGAKTDVSVYISDGKHLLD